MMRKFDTLSAHKHCNLEMASFVWPAVRMAFVSIFVSSSYKIKKKLLSKDYFLVGIIFVIVAMRCFMC
jgi:hypothetical protein